MKRGIYLEVEIGIYKQTGVKAYVQVVVVDDFVVLVLKGEIGYVKRKNREEKGKLRMERGIYRREDVYKGYVQVTEEKVDEVTVLKEIRCGKGKGRRK